MSDISPTQPKQLLTLNPILFVADLAETIQYYQKTLGFQKDWDYGDPAFYASVSRDGIAVHLRRLEHLPPHNRHAGTDTVDFYYTVSDVDRLYHELFGCGAKVVYGPAKQEYGMKEFYVEDCNGYRLGFGQQI